MAEQVKPVKLAHPGKFGDLLWALPTARALAITEEEYGGVSLYLPESLRSIGPLLEKQGDYIAGVTFCPDWQVQDTAPATPLTPPGQEEMSSLGYTGWPTRPLPFEVAAEQGFTNPPEEFWRPWIDVAPLTTGLRPKKALIVHWTDRWFELKIGLLRELWRNLPSVDIQWYAAPGTRMAEAGAIQCDWVALARVMTDQPAVLTDCSSAHVLAAAIGVPNILVVEPETDRHHFIFWPGSDNTWHQRNTRLGRSIRPVVGGDYKPTFDSRHTIDAINEVFNAVRG